MIIFLFFGHISYKYDIYVANLFVQPAPARRSLPPVLTGIALAIMSEHVIDVCILIYTPLLSLYTRSLISSST